MPEPTKTELYGPADLTGRLDDLNYSPSFVLDARQVRLRAPFTALAALLGRPIDLEGKMSTMWVLSAAAEPRVLFYVYDFFDEGVPEAATLARTSPCYDWTVEAPRAEALAPLCRWLSAAVIKTALGSTKVLSPEGKLQLNALVSGGMPLGQAMKQVQAQMGPAQDPLQKYAWPIVQP